MTHIALITGATGCLGHALAAHLVQSGQWGEVRALVRPGADCTALPSGVRPVVGTMEGGKAALREAVSGANVVFHAAAKVHDSSAPAEVFERINVQGTQDLLEAFAETGATTRPPRFIFFSTVAVYGEDTVAEGVPEDAPVKPATPYALSKVEGEKRVAAWGEMIGGVGISLRVATVYGPRDRGNMLRMLDAVARGRFVLIGNGENRKTCAAVDNVVAAAVAAATAPAEQVTGQPIVVADPSPYTLRELQAAMQQALELSHKGRRLSPSAALFIAAGLETVAKIAGKQSAPLTRAQIHRLMSNNVYQMQRLPQITGYQPRVSLSEGMVQAATWYREKGARV